MHFHIDSIKQFGKEDYIVSLFSLFYYLIFYQGKYSISPWLINVERHNICEGVGWCIYIVIFLCNAKSCVFTS